MPRPPLPRRTIATVAVIVASSLVVAGVVQAALPPKGAKFSMHDHVTAGKNWHVEIQVDAQNNKRIKTLVVYSEQCRGTVAKTNVPISDAGVVAAGGALTGGGTWAVAATFRQPTTLVGTMRMTRAGCDTGVLSFPNAITGDGHTDHEHGGGGGHAHGPKYADFDSASAHERRQAMALHRRVLTSWGGATLAEAHRRGFRRHAAFKGKVIPQGTFHVYNARFENDKRIFDAKHPESLVFWRQANGRSVLLGPMFRVPPGKRPGFAGPIPIYHHHESKTGKVVNRMTHVWMVKAGRQSAWAGCLPVTELKQYNPAFEWSPASNVSAHSPPC